MRIRAFVVLAALVLAPAAGVNAQEAQPPAEPEVGSVDFGGQFSTMDGDEARYQKYKDMRSSALLDAFKYTRGTDDWVFNVAATHVGYRDQRYVASSATSSGRKSRSRGIRFRSSTARTIEIVSDCCRPHRTGGWATGNTASTTTCRGPCRRCVRCRRARRQPTPRLGRRSSSGS